MLIASNKIIWEKTIMNEKQEIIPFGQFKGQPVEILAKEKEYTEWLLTQPWFKVKYKHIHTLIIHNFRDPIDTPEHNAIQVKFLDQSYSLKLAYFLEPNLFSWDSKRINSELSKILNKPGKHKTEIIKNLLRIKNKKLLTVSIPSLEGGYDVSYSVRYGVFIRFEYELPDRDDTFFFDFDRSHFMNLSVEIKPTIGDDFPSVLRQMKASMPTSDNDRINKRYNCLLVGDYTGEGANREQFIQYFQTQGYRVIFASDLDSITLPQIDKEINLELFEKNS